MENLPSNQPLVILAVALISSVTTIAVTLISKRVEKHVSTRPPKDTAGYERLIKYIDKRLDESEKANVELRGLLEKAKDREIFLTDQNSRMRTKLLEVSREFGVDISNVIQ